MDGSVAVLLVSHDGDRWLPQVLDRLAAQTVTPDRVVAVDTGSRDGSVAVLRDRLGQTTVHETDRDTSYPQAVRLGLEALGPAGADDWVWLLHDDSAPAPDALERLLEARRPGGPDVLGPKIREWPSLRRLLEVGVTITGTGRRETGLERGEHDQGQHDDPRDVLAVNTAGMLVRRTVLEHLGLDDELPVLHTDLDLGWRAHRAGVQVRTVPTAVVFHAEATRNGTRGPGASRGTRHQVEREAALFTVLANCAAPALPFVAVRLLLGSLLRAVGLLLVRAPAESWGELRAAAVTVLHPGRILRARRSRRTTAVVGPRAVRPRLAPAWLPYRHGLDELAGIAAAVVTEAGARSGSDDGVSLAGRLRRSPALWLGALLAVAGLVAARELVGDGPLAGGALLPAPDSALDWWRTYLATTHDVGTGSASAAPTYLVPFALLATLLVGSAGAALSLVLLAAVPLAGLGAYRLLRRVVGSPWVATWGASSYAVLIATSGAVTQGRVGTLVAAAVLPWLARSAIDLAHGSADRRQRAAWRTSLWLALAAAFAPPAWFLGAGVALAVVIAGTVTGRMDRGRAVTLLLPLPVALVLLLPWVAFLGQDGSWSRVLLEAGLPAGELVGPLGALDVLGARASDTGTAPVWVAAATALLATAALLRRSTRRTVASCWLVALVGLAAVRVLSAVTVDDPLAGGTTLVWSGLPLLVAHGAWLTAVAVAADGARGVLGDRSFGWRQPLGLVLVGLALVLPVCGTAWWLWHGSDDPVERAVTDTVPAYMDSAAERDRSDGTLVLRGGPADGITAEVRRGAPLTLGEEALVPDAAAQAELLDAVGDLVSAPDRDTVIRLAGLGVAFVHVPDPVDPELAAALDAVPALAAASADDETARAWRLDAPTSMPSVAAAGPGWLRPLLVGLQALALVAVVVLAAPTRRRRP